MVPGVVLVVGGMVAGTLDVVTGTVVVGASVVVVGAAVVVVSTGGAGGGGGDVVFGADVPVFRGGVVVTTGREVVAVVADGTVSPGRVTTVVVEDASVLLVDPGTVTAVTGGRNSVTVVVTMVDDWVATCCFGVAPEPVATSNIRPTKATDAMAYRPTLNR